MGTNGIEILILDILQFPKYFSTRTVLSFSMWKSAVIFRLQKNPFSGIDRLTWPLWKILKLVTKHLGLPGVENQRNKGEARAGTSARGRGGALGPPATWGGGGGGPSTQAGKDRRTVVLRAGMSCVFRAEPASKRG